MSPTPPPGPPRILQRPAGQQVPLGPEGLQQALQQAINRAQEAAAAANIPANPPSTPRPPPFHWGTHHPITQATAAAMGRLATVPSNSGNPGSRRLVLLEPGARIPPNADVWPIPTEATNSRPEPPYQPPPVPRPTHRNVAFSRLPTMTQPSARAAYYARLEEEEQESNREFRRWARIQARRDVWMYGGADDLVQDDAE
ncbi:MAG: hypothetical protein L6R35_006704 [Caloplaca aegaea]|nr:MAG: hypothetical protein L6R35_006704 [Caloplaca aegaea]